MMTGGRALIRFGFADQIQISRLLIQRQFILQPLIARSIVRGPLARGGTIPIAVAASAAAASSARAAAALFVARLAARFTAVLRAARGQALVALARRRGRHWPQIQIAAFVQIELRLLLELRFGRRGKVLQIVVLIRKSRGRRSGSSLWRTVLATTSAAAATAAASTTPPAFARAVFGITAQPADRITAQPADRITAQPADRISAFAHGRAAAVRIVVVAHVAHGCNRLFAQVQVAIAFHFIVQHEAFIVLGAEGGRRRFAPGRLAPAGRWLAAARHRFSPTRGRFAVSRLPWRLSRIAQLAASITALAALIERKHIDVGFLRPKHAL
jgi:hypothetical protein